MLFRREPWQKSTRHAAIISFFFLQWQGYMKGNLLSRFPNNLHQIQLYYPSSSSYLLASFLLLNSHPHRSPFHHTSRYAFRSNVLTIARKRLVFELNFLFFIFGKMFSSDRWTCSCQICSDDVVGGVKVFIAKGYHQKNPIYETEPYVGLTCTHWYRQEVRKKIRHFWINKKKSK